MANIFQKFIYNSSIASPILIVFAIVWRIQKKSSCVSIVCVGVAIILVLSMLIPFSYGKKHLAPIQIRTNEISPCDGRAVIYILTYMLPFASMAIDDFNIYVSSIIAIVIALTAIYVNTAVPNPILFFLGYHFYTVGAENRITGYVLISKRDLRNQQALKNVKRIFEFLLLDMEE